MIHFYKSAASWIFFVSLGSFTISFYVWKTHQNWIKGEVIQSGCDLWCWSFCKNNRGLTAKVMKHHLHQDIKGKVIPGSFGQTMRVTQDQGGLNEIFAFTMSSGIEHHIQVDWVLNKHPIIVLFPSFVNNISQFMWTWNSFSLIYLVFRIVCFVSITFL